MIEVKNLTIEFGTRRVLDNVNIEIKKGQILGIVGESGSGKTMTALSIMGLLNSEAHVVSGSVIVDGREIMGLPEKELMKVRGNDVAMVFQEPMTSLNPTMRIGKQLKEAMILHPEMHENMSKEELERKAKEALEEVNLPGTSELLKCYPHELSGGMRQRVMIAMGCINRPDYLLFDEPTTALDVTTEKGIIELIKRIKDEHDMGIAFITHDLKLVRDLADEVAVMCNGKIVERGTPEEIFDNPKEDYTKRLISAIPDRTKRRR